METSKEINKGFQGISGSTLKIIAAVTMFIDHIGASVIEQGVYQYYGTWSQSIYLFDRVLRMIGRVSFPIFCFLLVEGMLHTRSIKKYLSRLFLFGLISEIPFDLAFTREIVSFEYTNVYFTLLIGLAVIALMQYVGKNGQRISGILLQIGIAVAGMCLAEWMRTDYGANGVLLIVIFYLFRNQKVLRTIIGGASLYWEPTAIAAFVPLWFYNGKRGFKMKYFFYIFYPGHLLFFAFITNYFF